MGYYTVYSLDVSDEKGNYLPDETISNVIHEFRETCYYASLSLDDMGNPEEQSKWYDHEDDLKKFSLKYPNFRFCLCGEGEGGGDLWKLYVKNGKSQRASSIITYEPFDESLLN